MASLGRLKSAIFDRGEMKMQYQSHIRGLNAYDRHKKFIKDYGLLSACMHGICIGLDYKKGKIGLRWRTEKEVISGKGQFICGNRHCDEKHGLGSYEVNFSYVEVGEQKQALVKLVACKRCAEKLAYKRQKEKEKEKEKELSGEKEIELKERDKRKREHEESDDTSEDESTEKYSRKKEIVGREHLRAMRKNDEGFEEFIEGMFP